MRSCSFFLFHIIVNWKYLWGFGQLVKHHTESNLVTFTGTCYFLQAAELAEFTAKIALLEEAKRKKEDEATEWQHKVM